MNYELTIVSDGSPLVSVESDTLKDIINRTNKLGIDYYKKGKRALEVVWEDFPDEDYDTILNFMFPWEDPLGI